MAALHDTDACCCRLSCSRRSSAIVVPRSSCLQGARHHAPFSTAVALGRPHGLMDVRVPHILMEHTQSQPTTAVATGTMPSAK